MADVDAIINGLVAVEKRVPGIKSAFQYVPDLPAPLPCFINLVESGDVVTPRFGQGVREATHRIKAIALIAQQANLREAERIARPLITDFIETLDNYKDLDSAADVLSADVVAYEYGPFQLAGQEQPYVGVQFSVEVVTVEVGVTYSTTG